MVFLAITAAGLQQAIGLAKGAPFPIWCGADSIAEDEYEMLRGVDLSRFSYTLDGSSPELLQCAIETIAEHHPGEVIWVEQGRTVSTLAN